MLVSGMAHATIREIRRRTRRRTLPARRDLVADLKIPAHRIGNVEALERAGHVGTRLVLPVAIDVHHVAFLELVVYALGVPVLDAEADVADRRGHTVARLRDRR